MQANNAAKQGSAALPDPLTLSDGTRVATPELWRSRRRSELLELFRSQVYGRVPVVRPVKQQFEVVTTAAESSPIPGAARKQVTITLEGTKGRKLPLQLHIFIPSKRQRPAPAFLLLCNRGDDNIDPTRVKKSPFWPAEEIVARGYAAVALQVGEIAPDRDTKCTEGVFTLFDEKRGPDAWATIAAWAWGASHALDYLETDKDIDARRVAVVGHSRGGKTALWAGAEDERFALVISNDSGCTGAAITRGKKGERIADINKGFPYWFCENYKRYNGREEDLPVDQHELLALIAPRPVYVASASEDTWADPESEFRACIAAEPVYRLFNLSGVGADHLPRPESPLHKGAIGYHLRTGKHDLTLYDWTCYLDFADGKWGSPNK